MYYPATFNSLSLFQTLAAWIDISQKKNVKDRAHSFLHRAHQALLHIDEAARFQQSALEQFSNVEANLILPEETVEIRGASPLVSAAIVHVSAALASLKVMQNEAWCLLTAGCDARDGPSSMHDAYNALRPRSQGKASHRWINVIPHELQAAVREYWDSAGCSLAAYRDVDQHFNVLATTSWIIFEGGRAKTVEIVLPDNPEAKSLAKFTYEKRVSASYLLKTGYNALHKLVEQIAGSFVKQRKPLSDVLLFSPPLAHVVGTARVTAIWIRDYEGSSAIVIGQTEDMRIQLQKVQLRPKKDT